jgi:DTW domain-containing protein YfiP
MTAEYHQSGTVLTLSQPKSQEQFWAEAMRFGCWADGAITPHSAAKMHRTSSKIATMVQVAKPHWSNYRMQRNGGTRHLCAFHGFIAVR